MSVKNGVPSQPTTRQIESFWLKAQGEKPTAALNDKISAAQTKGHLLYGVTLDSALGLFHAVWDDSPVTVGVRIKGESLDRIYTGTVQLSEQQKAQGRSCVQDLAKQMQRELEAEKAQPGR